MAVDEKLKSSDRRRLRVECEHTANTDASIANSLLPKDSHGLWVLELGI